MARPVWRFPYKLTMFQDCLRMDLHVTESLERGLVNTPISFGL